MNIKIKTDEKYEERLKIFYDFLGKLKKAKEWTLRKLKFSLNLFFKQAIFLPVDYVAEKTSSRSISRGRKKVIFK